MSYYITSYYTILYYNILYYIVLYYITSHNITLHSVLDFYIMQSYWPSLKANGTTKIHFSTIFYCERILWAFWRDKKKRFDGALESRNIRIFFNWLMDWRPEFQSPQQFSFIPTLEQKFCRKRIITSIRSNITHNTYWIRKNIG